MDRRITFDVESARLVSAGHLYADASWSMAAHAHPYWEFVYFLRGSGRVDVPSGTLRPQRYHLVVYPPGLPHAEMANPVDPEETVFFSVLVSGTPPVGAHLLMSDPKGEMRWLCERIVVECQSSGALPLAEAYMRAFLYLVERMWESGIPVQHDSIDTTVQFLHENYSQDITLRTLAEVAHVSETHLVHRFSARLGVSPLRYLQHLRMENARRLLSTTDSPVNEVAEQVGFGDPLYFSRAFRRSTGFSPSSFRQRSNSASQSMPDASESLPASGEENV